MKKNLVLSLVSVLLLAAGCSQKTVFMKTKGGDMVNIDDSVSPGNDFYQYACGNWIKENPLKPEYSRFGAFDQLRENNKKQIRTLIEKLGETANEKGSVAQKIGSLYKLGLDSVRLNKEGVLPLQQELSELEKVNSISDVSAWVARLHKEGAYPFFQLFVDADSKNSAMNMVHLHQGGINIGDRDYYLLDDDATNKIREAYRTYISLIFKKAGYTEEEAQKGVDAVMKIETELAKASFPREELRDPYRNYNKMTISDIKNQLPGFDWGSYFSYLKLDSLNEANIMQLPFMKGVSHVMKSNTLQDLKYYLTYNLLDASAPYLDDESGNISFDFYGKVLSGKQEQQPRWKRALDVTNNALSEAVGQMYVAEYFPPEAKTRMLNLVSNLNKALGERIDSVSWMGDSTKEKAKEKLAAFHVKIGYPDKWRDYSALQVDDSLSYWENVRHASGFEFDYMLSEAGKPVDKEKWYMSPQTVNAYYNPSTNEICFPAGILQPPFFYLDADDAVNYGAIGVVIGHEMTHGFDDQGRQFDKDGNLKEWWTADDAAHFDALAQKLAGQYDQIIVLDTVHANGQFTLGENIADQGGLQVAFLAFQNASEGQKQPVKIDGFTPQQRFFLSYASLWAENIRDEEILRRTKMDVHSLGKWRVNGALPNVDAFYKAFNISDTDSMYVKPENRIQIW